MTSAKVFSGMKTRNFQLWFLFCLASAAICIGLSAGTETVTTEPHRKFIPAGRGQRPVDVTRHTIPLKEIQPGGPAPDEIPALVRPRFVAAEQGDRLLKGYDRVLGVFFNGEAKAYPVRILNWHELVNDTLGGRPVLVAW